MSIENIVQITITTQSSGVRQAGFGVPLLLSPNAPFVGLVKAYATTTEMTDDGYATTDPEVAAANAFFAQNPAVPTIKMGKIAAPTQQFTFEILQAFDNTDYTVEVDGVEVTVNSGVAATPNSIAVLLDTALDGVVGLSSAGAPGGALVTMDADNAGDAFGFEAANTNLIGLRETTADVSAAADLAAIVLEDNLWYSLHSLYTSDAIHLANAAFAQANKKVYGANTNETEVIDIAEGSATDIAKQLKDLSYDRVFCNYHPSNLGFFAEGWAGLQLTTNPGTTTWNLKTIAGVAVKRFTTTQETNLKAKFCNYYTEIGGQNVTQEGWVSSGTFIDVTRSVDWVEARMSERVFALLASSGKVPYTDAGIAAIQAELQSVIQLGIRRGVIANDGTQFVRVPKAADAAPADKAARILRDVEFGFTLAGAVHTVIVQGTVSV